MNLYHAEIVSDAMIRSAEIVDVEASSMRVAFTKAARLCKMRQWAKIKVTFVRKISYVWILTRLDPEPENPSSKTWASTSGIWGVSNQSGRTPVRLNHPWDPGHFPGFR